MCLCAWSRWRPSCTAICASCLLSLSQTTLHCLFTQFSTNNGRFSPTLFLVKQVVLFAKFIRFLTIHNNRSRASTSHKYRKSHKGWWSRVLHSASSLLVPLKTTQLKSTFWNLWKEVYNQSDRPICIENGRFRVFIAGSW